MAYIYKRGQRAGAGSVKMKDLAQAYIAFWREEPHIAFARPGQIFAKDEEYYVEVFPPNRIAELKERGDRTQRRQFLLQRLLPWRITIRMRDFIRGHTGAQTSYEKKWRSLTYHMVWLYGRLLEEKVATEGISKVYEKADVILDGTLNELFEEICGFLWEAQVPRCLKSMDAEDRLRKVFMSMPRFQRIKTTIQSS